MKNLGVLAGCPFDAVCAACRVLGKVIGVDRCIREAAARQLLEYNSMLSSRFLDFPGHVVNYNVFLATRMC